MVEVLCVVNENGEHCCLKLLEFVSVISCDILYVNFNRSLFEIES